MLKENIKLFLALSCILIVLFGLTSISAADSDNVTHTDEMDISTSQATSAHDDDVQTKNLINKNLENGNNDKNVKASGEYNRDLYVKSTGNSSSDGTSRENPTTLTNALDNLENNDRIIFLANQTYQITANVTTKNLNTDITTFTISSEDKNSVVLTFFSTSSMEFTGNRNIKLENLSFTREYESEFPIITNNATLLSITNCAFYNINTSANHASIYNTKNLIITDCHFYNNTAKHEAGVIYTENSTLNVTGTLFENNRGDNGAVISSTRSTLAMVNNSFVNNNASFGGVFSLRDNSTLKDEKSFYESNTAKHYGGIIYSYYSSISINDSVFTDNRADTGGVIYSVNNRNTSIFNSLLSNNMADSAAGDVYSVRDNLIVSNCALISNNQTDSIYCFNGTCNIDGNWWGQNNPDFSRLTNHILPNNWRLLTLNALNINSSYAVEVSLNRLTDDTVINKNLINRTAYFSTQNGTLEFESASISSTITDLFTGDLEDLVVRVDNEELSVNDKIRPYLEIMNTAAYIDDDAPIIVKCNPDISRDILIYIDNTYFTSIEPVNGSGIIVTNFNSTWQNGTYTLTAHLTEDNKYEDTLVTSSLVLKNLEDPVVNYVKYNIEENVTNESVKSRLRLEDAQLVQTSVKNQGASGSCWAFSTLATLESAYLKAYGIEYDFSENNMKNVLKKYSTIGDVSSNPNEGNGELEPIALLVGWYGPADESEDVYYDKSITSPLLNNSVKVQDVYFIYRNTFVGKDNKALKEAILKYGALSSSIYSSYSTFYSKSVYTDATAYADHAITIVGWDDFYSTSNFYGMNKPAGSGAYIIKDSWGESIGEGGYQYVSYYDTSLAGVQINSNMTGFSYAFPVQTYENYTNIYQHDTISTNIKLLTPSSWIRNIYTARGNESIAAVGTFIYEDCDYEAYIYVNNKLALTQTGNFTQAGYRTIKLNEYVSVNEGDTFRVDLKLTARNGAYTPVTIQDTGKYKSISRENQSFISSDGVTWSDLFYDSDFKGSAACLKVYTMDAPRLVSSVAQENDSYTITSNVSNLNSNGKLSYILDDEYYTDNNGNVLYINVDANKTYDVSIVPRNIKHSNYNLTVNLDVGNYTYSELFNMTTPLNLKITTTNYTYYVDDTQSITALITIENDYNTPANEGKIVLIKDSAIVEECDIVNGSVTFNISEEYGNHSYTLSYTGSTLNVCADATTIINIRKHDVRIEIGEIENNQLNKNMTINGIILSDNDEPMSNAPLEVEIGEYSYDIASNEDGEFSITHLVEAGGNYLITVKFNENATHNYAIVEENVTIEKINSIITLENIEDAQFGEVINITGHLTSEDENSISNDTVNLNVNNELYEVPVYDGTFTLSYEITSFGQNNVTATFDANPVYQASCTSTTFIVKRESTFLFYNIKSSDKGDVVKISAKLLSDGVAVTKQNVEVTINNETYTTKTSTTGYFTIDYTAQTEGINNVSFSYRGNEEYLAAHNDTTFIVRKEAFFLFYKIKDSDLGETIKVSAKLLSDQTPVKGQTVTITINNDIYTAKTSTTGYFTIDYTATITGTNSLTYAFNGNAEYEAASNTTTFIINQPITKENATFLFYKIKDANIGDIVKISGKLLNNKTPVKNRNINIIINNVTYTLKTSSTGYFAMDYTANTGGVNNLTYSFEGDLEYYATSNKTTFIINQPITKENATFLFYKIKDANMGDVIKISGKLLNNNTPVKNRNINLIINNVTYTLKTSSTGYFAMDYTANTGGVNNLTYSFEGDLEYYATSNITTFNVTADKNETSFLFYKIGDAALGSSVKISGKLLSGDVPAVRQNVSIIVNDEVFHLTTSTTGYFVMEYVASCSGTYNLTYLFEGSVYYEPTQNSTTFKVLD